MKKAVCLLRQNHIFIVLTAVLLYGVFFVEHFTKVGNLYNLLLNTSLYGLIAVGMTFALLTGDVDISIGMQTAISAIVACLATSQFGFFPGVLLTILSGAVIGYLNGAVVTFLRTDAFIITLGTLTILKGVGLALTKTGAVSSSDTVIKELYAYKILNLIPVPFLLFVLVLAFSFLLLRYTRFGIHVYVIGGNKEAGRMAGVRVNRTRRLCFLLAGLCAAIGGIVLASRMNTGDILLGENLSLKVISACVIGGISIRGGKGNLMKMVTGVLVIQTVDNVISLKGVPGSVQLLISGMLLVIVLIVDRLSRVRPGDVVRKRDSGEERGTPGLPPAGGRPA